MYITALGISSIKKKRKTFKRGLIFYTCVCVPVCKPHECYTRTWHQKAQMMTLKPPYLELWVVVSCPVWVWGTELTSFVRTVLPTTDPYF